MEPDSGFQNGNNKKMKTIDYNSFIEKIIETKSNNYNCTILLFYTGEIMSGEGDIIIEEEDNFYNIFSDLIYYIETKCCNTDERDNFKVIINSLIDISSERKLDKIDINYILFKEKILQLIDKFKNKKITEKVLEEQFYKLFEIKDYNFLLNQLDLRYNIKIE